MPAKTRTIPEYINEQTQRCHQSRRGRVNKNLYHVNYKHTSCAHTDLTLLKQPMTWAYQFHSFQTSNEMHLSISPISNNQWHTFINFTYLKQLMNTHIKLTHSKTTNHGHTMISPIWNLKQPTTYTHRCNSSETTNHMHTSHPFETTNHMHIFQPLETTNHYLLECTFRCQIKANKLKKKKKEMAKADEMWCVRFALIIGYSFWGD